MVKKRKKLIQKITGNRKFKRVLWGIFIFFALLCLGAAFSEKTFRTSVNIAGFESAYSDVSSKTRKALKSELDDFVLLNTGNSIQKPKFKVREGQDITKVEDDDGNKFSVFLMDSDELQISARVQMYWGKGFGSLDTSFIARVDCASPEDSRYEDSHCFSHSTGEAARAIAQDNLALLESYGVPSKAIKTMQSAMLEYLKIAYPKTASVLVKRENIENSDTTLRAKLALDNGKTFDLIVEKKVDWAARLQSGGNAIWESSADRKVTSYRHYSSLKKNLPVEIETKSGARITMSYIDKNQLGIGSMKCTEKTTNSELEQAAKDWLEENDYESEAYKIKLKNSCEN